MASPHIILFPFMSKGHTIPILHLARLLLQHGSAVTLFTTPANRPFISADLADTAVSIIDLPFPQNIEGIPSGVESTDKLPDISKWYRLGIATKLMKPYFEKALDSLPRISFMVTDGFLGWTLDSAEKFGVPRLVYYGMNNFSMALSHAVSRYPHVFVDLKSENNNLFTIPSFPWIKLSKIDFNPLFLDLESHDKQHYNFVSEMLESTAKSYGLIVNSFYELEPAYNDYCNREVGPKAWCVGPLCLAAPPQKKHQRSPWIQWLDRKQEEGKPVLYVAFGSQADISVEQIKQIKTGLERSGVNFLWVVRKIEAQDDVVFEQRVKDRGMVVKEWVDQREILEHSSVQGFLSHCGWNSVIESICAKVPILAWPMMAEQPLNAKMVEEIGTGLRVETSDGEVFGFVQWVDLEKIVKELMEGELGKKVRKRVKEVGDAAARATADGGSSWLALNELINELHPERSN